MNFFAAVESDLARRIRRALSGGVRRMGTKSRVVAAILVCLMAAVTLPYSSIAQTSNDVDWEAVKTTPPEEWPEELKEQIVAAGYNLREVAQRVRQGQEKEGTGDERNNEDGVDWETVKTTPPEKWSEELKAQIIAAGYEVEAIAERIRLSQGTTRDEATSDLDAIGRRIRAAVASGAMTAEEGRRKMEEARQAMGGEPSREEQIWKVAMATDPDEWSDRLKAAILELRPDSTIEEIADAIRQRQQAVREGGDERLREFQRGVAERAMAMDPDEWSDELKAAIARAGWDLDEFTEGIRQRQAAMSESSTQSTGLESQADENTAIQESSWGKVKKESRNPK
jgi:transposase-like protein